MIFFSEEFWKQMAPFRWNGPNTMTYLSTHWPHLLKLESQKAVDYKNTHRASTIYMMEIMGTKMSQPVYGNINTDGAWDMDGCRDFAK